jgi:dTMP kinase
MSVNRGRFLTFEGVDGAGKSTHVAWVVQWLESHGKTVISSREPGGTPVGEAIRALVLNTPMHLETETLLMFAARAEHVRTVIEPALAAGKWVVCDRFTDATQAYQGAGRQLGQERVTALANWVHPNLQPDRTWLFDVPLDVAKERLNRTRTQDRFEQEEQAFFVRTQNAYRDLVKQNPDRFKTIDGTQTIESIRNTLNIDLLAFIQLDQASHHAVQLSGANLNKVQPNEANCDKGNCDKGKRDEGKPNESQQDGQHNGVLR